MSRKRYKPEQVTGMLRGGGGWAFPRRTLGQLYEVWKQIVWRPKIDAGKVVLVAFCSI